MMNSFQVIFIKNQSLNIFCCATFNWTFMRHLVLKNLRGFDIREINSSFGEFFQFLQFIIFEIIIVKIITEDNSNIFFL